MINSPYLYVRAFVMCNELDLTKTNIFVIQQWIYNVNEMHAKADKRSKK